MHHICKYGVAGIYCKKNFCESRDFVLKIVAIFDFNLPSNFCNLCDTQILCYNKCYRVKMNTEHDARYSEVANLLQ